MGDEHGRAVMRTGGPWKKLRGRRVAAEGSSSQQMRTRPARLSTSFTTKKTTTTQLTMHNQATGTTTAHDQKRRRRKRQRQRARRRRYASRLLSIRLTFEIPQHQSNHGKYTRPKKAANNISHATFSLSEWNTFFFHDFCIERV